MGRVIQQFNMEFVIQDPALLLFLQSTRYLKVYLSEQSSLEG
jgi:hypothetical protein